MTTDKRIRIFVDGHCFDQEYQGSRTFVKEIYRILVQRKDLLFFIGASDIEELKKNITPSENIIYIKYKSRSPISRLAIEIPGIIRRNNIEIAHFQYITPLVKNCKQIVTIHDVIFSEYPGEFTAFYRFYKKMLYKRSARMANIITTVSEFSRNSIRKQLIRSDNKINLVSNGVHPSYFEPYHKESSRNYIREKYGINKFILYVSRIEPRKNHFFLLKAFLELKLFEKGYQLVLLGHTSKKPIEFERLKNSLPETIRKFIYESNEVDDKDLLEFYRAADLFVYPSRAEGFGIPPLEAAAVRSRVLCSNTAAMKEFSFFEDFQIDPYQYESLKNKLSSILSKEPDDERLEKIAFAVRQQYSWERSADKLYELIKNELS